jgi:hypothetical protein
MVGDFRNQADGRHVAAAESANHPLPASLRSPMVRFCTWCKEICIRPNVICREDSIIVYIYGEERKAFWNGRELMVGDGICEKCHAERFPETVQKGKTP